MNYYIKTIYNCGLMFIFNNISLYYHVIYNKLIPCILIF